MERREEPAAGEGGSGGDTRWDDPERLKTILDAVGACIFVKDAGRRYVYANRAARELFGARAQGITGAFDDEIFPPPAAAAIRDGDLAVLGRGETVSGEETLAVGAGEQPRTWWTVKFPLREPDGQISGLCGVSTEITQLRRVERSLQLSEERFRKVFETSPESIGINRLGDGLYVAVNPGFTRTTGFAEAEVLGTTPLDLGLWVDPGDRERLLAALRASGEVRDLEARFRMKDRSVREGLMSASLITIDGVPHVVSVTRDVTDRKLAEAHLRESELRYRELAESLPLTVFEFDRQGRFTYVNRAGLEIFGYTREDIERGLNVLEGIVAEDRERAGAAVARRLAGNPDSLQEYGALRKDGTSFPMTIDSAVVYRDGQPAGLRGVLSDLTLRKQVQEHALTAAKLASVGTLAGGIAHDFNNLLQGVSGSISLALHALDRPEEARALLEQAETALHRSVSLTNQLLAFAKGGQPVKKVVAPGPLVEAAARFALSGSSIACEFFVGPEVRAVEVDEGQIAQAVHNLVLNALQAMPEGGRITIAVRNAPAAELLAAGIPGAADFVEISVRDEGRGIPPEHLGRIFDPYFSTKEAGSGLGLASTHAIVVGHGGEIRVSSKVGRGSVFSVYLPASASVPEARVPEPRAAAGAGRRVLLMDDDPLLQRVAASMLRRLGHEVEIAPDGGEAVALFQQARAAGAPFDLVILDLTVRGGMGGKEALRRLQEIEPSVRAIVSSGYSEDAAIASYQEHGFRAALRKPYRVADLEGALERALG
ncbi:MAG TPA: PAS domain S-box protein [bacterium]